MQSILFGNGLNRLTKGNPSWEDLLDDIAKENLEKDIPNTLRYEAIIVKQPYKEPPVQFVTADGLAFIAADGKRFFASGEVVEDKLKKDIADRVGEFEPNRVYDMISTLPVEHFMTTNYDNTLLKTLGDRVSLKMFRQERTYSIRRHYLLTSELGEQTYWPIHGSMDSHTSIMLGFDHYCGALSRIERYVKGNYDLPGIGRVPSMTSKLKDGNEDYRFSWIDLFFVSDVHIIGLELAYEEMDLWWILNKRRRMKQKGEVKIDNRIVFYPVSDLSRDKRQLLTGFDVDICDLDNYKVSYETKYKMQLALMRRNMRRVGVAKQN